MTHFRWVVPLLLCLVIGGVLAGGGSDDHHGGALRQALQPGSLAPVAMPTAVPGGPGYLMLAASDFKADSDQDKYFRYWGGNFIEPAEGSSGIGLSAAVHLPQGARITQITAYYYDSDPASAPLVDLYRGITGTLELIGNLSAALPDDTFAGGEDVRSAAVSGSVAVVDNSRYSYIVTASLNRDPATPVHTQRLHGVRVDYDFPVALPLVTR